MEFEMQLSTLLGNHTKHLSELEQATIRPLLQLAVKVIDHNFIDEGALGLISKNFDVPQEVVNEWFAALLTILKLHLRTPSISLKPAEFKQYLQELKFSPECVQDIISVLTGPKRPELMRSFAKKTEFFPHIASCKWRLDVIVSSSSISKVSQPSILMEWILSDGQTHTFELSASNFHKLRHAVAKLMTELQRLESFKVIQDYSQTG